MKQVPGHPIGCCGDSAWVRQGRSQVSHASPQRQRGPERIRPMSMAGLANILGLIPVMWPTGTGADVMKRLAAPMVDGVLSAISRA